MRLPKPLRRVTLRLTAALLLSLAITPVTFGQLAGSRGGVVSDGTTDMGPPVLSHEVADQFITIDGSAELRVAATELRVVMAISSEGLTAFECQAKAKQIAGEVIAAWRAAGLPEEAIYEDFIAILPKYQWQIETQETQQVAVERLVGYRMQINLHVATVGEKQANTVIDEAFKLGITDIIGFDYWHPELDELKQQALAQAIKAAKTKSAVLLDAVFDQPPPVINLQEKTTTYLPEALYQSFASAYSESIELPSRRNLPSITAWRPKNTYYRGLQSDADVTPSEIALRPEITIVSRVRLYYRSPGAAMHGQDEHEAKH